MIFRKIGPTLCALVLGAAITSAPVQNVYSDPPQKMSVSSDYGTKLYKRAYTTFGIETKLLSLHKKNKTAFTLIGKSKLSVDWFRPFFPSIEDSIVDTIAVYGMEKKDIRPVVKNVMKSLEGCADFSIIIEHNVGNKGYIKVFEGYDKNSWIARGKQEVSENMTIGIMHYAVSEYFWVPFDKTIFNEHYTIKKEKCGDECTKAIRKNKRLYDNKTPWNKRVYEGDIISIMRKL